PTLSRQHTTQLSKQSRVPSMTYLTAARDDHLTRVLPFFLLPRPPRSTLFPYTTLSDLPVGSASPVRQPDQERVPEAPAASTEERSEEHTSELQSPDHLVCRLLLEKKKIRKAKQAWKVFTERINDISSTHSMKRRYVAGK